MGLIWYGIVSARNGDKNIKNHWVFKVVEGPRPFKRASEDSKGFPRCYLGLLEAILNHLGAILEKKLFKKVRLPAPVKGARHLSTFWGSFWSNHGRSWPNLPHLVTKG